MADAKTTANGDHPLTTNKCTIRFGGLVAVNELDMSVREGEIYGLIGPNGAGKTTIFNLLTGVYTPTSGELYFQGERIDGLKPPAVYKHVSAGKRYDRMSPARQTEPGRRRPPFAAI